VSLNISDAMGPNQCLGAVELEDDGRDTARFAAIGIADLPAYFRLDLVVSKLFSRSARAAAGVWCHDPTSEI
jgi:hypothetical protein